MHHVETTHLQEDLNIVDCTIAALDLQVWRDRFKGIGVDTGWDRCGQRRVFVSHMHSIRSLVVTIMKDMWHAYLRHVACLPETWDIPT